MMLPTAIVDDPDPLCQQRPGNPVQNRSGRIVVLQRAGRFVCAAR